MSNIEPDDYCDHCGKPLTLNEVSSYGNDGSHNGEFFEVVCNRCKAISEITSRGRKRDRVTNKARNTRQDAAE